MNDSLQPTNTSIGRAQFLQRFVDTGLTFAQASKVFDAMCSVFADGVVTGRKVGVGRVLAIVPVRKKARRVNCALHGARTTYHLSDRIDFSAKVYGEFLAKHQVDWKI